MIRMRMDIRLLQVLPIYVLRLLNGFRRLAMLICRRSMLMWCLQSAPKEGVALMASLLHFGEDDVVVQPKVSYPTYEIGTQLAGAQALKVDDVADVASWRNVPGVKAVWVNSPLQSDGRGCIRPSGWLALSQLRVRSARWCFPTNAMR